MLATLLVAVVETPSGPQESPFEPSPGPFIALTVLGFMVAAFGHLIKSKTLIGAGLAMAFAGILLLPLAIYLGGGS